MICARSKFFYCAMNGDWVEKDERLVKLPEDDPEIFGIYANLVYTGKIAIRSSETAKGQVAKHALQAEHTTLCILYVLAEKLQDTLAKDAIVTSIRAICKESLTHEIEDFENQDDYHGGWFVLTASAVSIIYEGTVRGSPARRLMVDMLISEPICFKRIAADLPHEALVDVAIALMPEYLDEVSSCEAYIEGIKGKNAEKIYY
jgi:hypothetical protein